MKLALDPVLLQALPAEAMLRSVAEAGFRYVELSPRGDLLAHGEHRRPSAETISEFVQASVRTGVEVASLFLVQPWASSDEERRRAAVAALQTGIETALALGCNRINTELTGDPATPEQSRAALLRSLDELLPLLERENFNLAVEPHPYDFLERNDDSVDLVRAIGSEHVSYLYCAPHTFYLGDDIAQMVAYAADVLDHVHIADSFRPARIIANPNDGSIRLHQHLDVGQGEVDWSALFAALAEHRFDGVLTVAGFAWPDRAAESIRANFHAVTRLLRESGLAETAPAESR
jgi:myo-inositol catabolism protein IolH